MGSVSIYYSEKSGYTNGGKFEGPWSKDDFVKIHLEPLPFEQLKPGTVYEVGKEMGEVIVISPK